MTHTENNQHILQKVQTLEQDAIDFGFRWESSEQIMDQIRSELIEIDEHLTQRTADIRNSALLQEEIGDLLHAAFSLCVFCDFEPEKTLNQALAKFERRLNSVKGLAAKQGFNSLEGKSFEELMAFWREAKTRVG